MKKEQNLNNAETQALNIPVVISRFLLWYKQVKCKHEKWDCDTQIYAQ